MVPYGHVRYPLQLRRFAVRGEHVALSDRGLLGPDRTWGALDVYSTERDGFSDEDVLQGQTIAALAAVALARSINDEQLASALETRTTIGQAIGIVMERHELDADHAFSVLRRISSQDNLELRDLAAQVVATREVPHRHTPTEP